MYRPETWEAVEEAIDVARRQGRPVVFRGAGRSYGDAALATGGVVVDFSRLRSILAWDPEQGTIDVEPGVTIHDLWTRVLPDGWWPPVVPGTATVTVGGAAAMNVHGKNHWKAGCFGDHVLEFEIVLPSGERLVCDRTRNADLFHAAIGGFGMLGYFTRLRLQLKKVETGNVVRAFLTRNLSEALTCSKSTPKTPTTAWLDGFAWATGSAADHPPPITNGSVIAAPCPHAPARVPTAPRGLIRVLPRSHMWRLCGRSRTASGCGHQRGQYAVDRRSHRSPEPEPWPLAAYSSPDAVPTGSAVTGAAD